MTYTPPPGTIAARALAHLQSHPPGTKLPTAELNDAIGLPPDYPLSQTMQHARRHGLVKATPVPGRRYVEWQLCSATPETSTT